ncbi:hypothetical protein HAX54_043192 [Datura stramonium]|uniref:Uncharacterized protein n=1 Tax=Datura stramonium TaxID=4076 RepID=A0ABS8W509_DATST|nr:hypothetical protein [Datura stramonium]
MFVFSSQASRLKTKPQPHGYGNQYGWKGYRNHHQTWEDKSPLDRESSRIVSMLKQNVEQQMEELEREQVFMDYDVDPVINGIDYDSHCKVITTRNSKVLHSNIDKPVDDKIVDEEEVNINDIQRDDSCENKVVENVVEAIPPYNPL